MQFVHMHIPDSQSIPQPKSSTHLSGRTNFLARQATWKQLQPRLVGNAGNQVPSDAHVGEVPPTAKIVNAPFRQDQLSCSPSNLEAATAPSGRQCRESGTVGRPCRRSATHSPVVSKRLSLRVRLSAHSSSSFCNPRTKVVSALRSACSHFTSTKYLLLSKNTVSGDALQCCVISKAVPETFVSYRVTVSLPAPS